MASYSRVLMLLLMLHLPPLFCFATCLKFEEDNISFGAQSKRNLAGSSLLCGAVNCLKGTCMDSSSFPFYQCQCDEGWKSPMGASFVPCVLPNCSIDLGCNNVSNTLPPAALPANGSFNACSLSVCGNGQCIPSGNSNLTYECKCNSGSTNLFNKSDGYCLQPCALGADCTNLNISLGAPPPPSALPASQNSSQGTSPSPSLSNQTIPSQGTRQAFGGNHIILHGILMLLIGWCF